MGCVFCASGVAGLKRHMRADEIVAQVLVGRSRLDERERIRNVVLMGMGEPLHNYDAVTAALRLLIEPRGGFGIAPRHVTLSTAGLAPAIERLALEPAVPRLAVSLNATTDEVRSRLMPVNRTWPIERLLEACREFLRRTGQLLFLEYVMLDGVNDTPQDLKRLARIAASLPARVNLIAFNEVSELPFSSSPPERMTRFREGLVATGVRASIRRSRGRDVRAACGQLAFAASQTAPPAGRPEARA
jgi:23S rRNA (adenine2503-C2)-methyltransferase